MKVPAWFLPFVFGILSRLAFAGVGDGALGSFDPSDRSFPIMGFPSLRVVYRSYSIIDVSAIRPSLGHRLVSTRVAVSLDGGANFYDYGVVNRATDTGQNIDYIHEVSTLVFDPADPNPNLRWKLIWHKYVQQGDVRSLSHSWLAMKSAGAVGGLTNPALPEVRFMAAALYNPGDGVTPTFRAPADCLAVSEPSAMTNVDGFSLAFNCFTSGGTIASSIRLIRFRHTALGLKADPPTTLLKASDAYIPARYLSGELSQMTYYSAPELVRVRDKLYLLVTPTNASDRYLGCFVMPVSEVFGSLQVLRDPAALNLPVITQYLPGVTGTHRGACTYSENSTGSGIGFSQLDMYSASPFKLLKTGVQIP